jgi:hypothetical protein
VLNLLSNFALYLSGCRTLRTLNANMRCTDCHSRCPTTATYILRCPTLSGSDGTTVCYPPVKYCHLRNAYGKARCETPQSGRRWQPASASYKLSTSSRFFHLWLHHAYTTHRSMPPTYPTFHHLRTFQRLWSCSTGYSILNARYKHLVHRLSL